MTRSLLLLTLIGCGDMTNATGEFGRLSYGLGSDYLVDESDLTQVGIITGYAQNIYVSSTGKDEPENPGDIVHTVSPDAGVELVTEDNGGDVPDFDITVEQAGTYTITSELDGEVFDRIDLVFETPSGMDRVLWVRQPGETEFTEDTGTTSFVDEGTQVAFVIIPLNQDGDRIVGHMDMTLSADPSEAVVPAYDILGSYEQQVVGSVNESSGYIIDPGTVEITASDTLYGLGTSQVFEVQPVGGE